MPRAESSPEAKREAIRLEAEKIKHLAEERQGNFEKSPYKSQAAIKVNKDVAKLTRELLISKALELRLTGSTYREIAQILNVDVRMAHTYVDEATRIGVTETVDRVRRLEVSRLDLYLRRLEPMLAQNDLAALDRALKIHERKSKLQGLEYRPAENPAGLDDVTKKLAEKFNISLEEAEEYIKQGQQLIN